jgi:hypothetical protein
LFDQGGNDNEIDVVRTMPRNEKGSKLAILGLRKLGFVNGETNTGGIVDQCRLTLPMNFLIAELEGSIPMEKGKGAMCMLQLKGCGRARTDQFDFGYSVLSEELSCAGNNGPGFVAFVDFDMVARVGFAVVLDILSHESGTIDSRTPVPASLHSRLKDFPSPLSRYTSKNFSFGIPWEPIVAGKVCYKLRGNVDC